jgi:UV DNA damage endonuclease
LAKISALCLANAEALRQSLEYCHRFGIGAFRILSTLLPVKTHPQAGYEVDRLPDADLLVDLLKACGRYAKE